MYLDETILQSRTTLTLIEYIEELIGFTTTTYSYGMNEKQLAHFDPKYRKLMDEFYEIKSKANKASKKRSFE